MPSVSSQLKTVAIADCVHYCGFRYGRGEFNPYENYVVGLAQGVPIEILREKFEHFLRHYRPRDLGEALGITTEQSIPLWLLPWKSWRKLRQAGGWRESLHDIVDIITYFSPLGIQRSRIQEEYGWLENAWRNLSREGYRPDLHSYITVFELEGGDASRYLVLDGNHRVSATAALGMTHIVVRQSWLSKTRRRNSRFWPLVLTRHVSHADACRIFDAYFTGNLSPPMSAVPTNIISDI